MKINFVTGNYGKVIRLQKHLAPFDINVQQVKLDLIEPQANRIEDIALAKAEQAFSQLNQPVVVEDSAFHIEALNGFPGPYNKYVLETLGLESFMALLNDLQDRRCYFLDAVVYQDQHGAKVFLNQPIPGQLAHQIDENNREHALSELWKVFIPEGRGQPLSALNESEINAWRTQLTLGTAYRNLAEYLTLRSNSIK